MTFAAVDARSTRDAVPAFVAPLAIALGCAALLMRPRTLAQMVATAGIGLIGILGPLSSVGTASERNEVERPERRSIARTWILVTVLGMAAFAVVRYSTFAAPVPFYWAGLAATTLAAVAEEAFFRRYCYGWLARRGAAVAIGVSAALFAAVHMPWYGLAAMPIDFAAGVLLGWQRWATGGWSSPAATHVFANVIQMG